MRRPSKAARDAEAGGMMAAGRLRLKGKFAAEIQGSFADAVLPRLAEGDVERDFGAAADHDDFHRFASLVLAEGAVEVLEARDGARTHHALARGARR